MINQTTYEYFGQLLAEAAEDVTLAIGSAITWAVKRVIVDPSRVYRDEDKYMSRVEQAAGQWRVDWQAWAQEDLANAYLQGIQHTDAELKALKTKREPQDVQLIRALGPRQIRNRPIITEKIEGKFKDYPNHLTMYGVFQAAAYDALERTHVQIMRESHDLYRDVAVMAGEQRFREGDEFIRREASQLMLNEFAEKGLQAITYRDGRRMSLDAYAEMVGRTMSGQAAVQASLFRYQEFGYDLVRVSQHFRTCHMCAPWEGKILSQSGESERYPHLQDAIDDGLFHPNCAHDISPYIPGVSPELELMAHPEEKRLIEEHGYGKAQEIAYNAQQQQRYIERKIRRWKRGVVTAMTEEERAAAEGKVKEWQKRMREHLKEHPYLPRKYKREQPFNAH